MLDKRLMLTLESYIGTGGVRGACVRACVHLCMRAGCMQRACINTAPQALSGPRSCLVVEKGREGGRWREGKEWNHE